MRIAVDAMGGDGAPKAPVEAAVAAARQGLAEVLLVGPAEALTALLPAGAPVRVVPAEEVIAGDDQPVSAVQKKKKSSIVVGVSLVRRGEADGFVSAGNTGALMAAGLFVCGRIPGVKRPAISGIFPTLDGVGCVVLDLGAHMDADPENLYQYALMGSVYAEKVRGIARPRVGLLNVGTEETKGNEVTRQAYHLFKGAPFNFVGNVEGRDIFTRAADVVVCDGFVGNVLLKTLEGLGQGIFALLRQELTAGWRERLGTLLVRPALKRFARRVDYAEYGGAPLLGVNGAIIKCHGSSDARALLNGIGVAVRVARERVGEIIGAEMAAAAPGEAAGRR